MKCFFERVFNSFLCFVSEKSINIYKFLISISHYRQATMNQQQQAQQAVAKDLPPAHQASIPQSQVNQRSVYSASGYTNLTPQVRTYKFFLKAIIVLVYLTVLQTVFSGSVYFFSHSCFCSYLNSFLNKLLKHYFTDY